MDDQILSAWGLAGEPCVLHATRENQVYRVGKLARFALRHHRQGLRTQSQIEAELTWMISLAEAGLPVPAPVRTRTEALVLEHEGHLYSLITWVPGQPLGHRQDPLTLPKPLQTFLALGQLIRRLHAVPNPTHVDRPDWTMDGLLGDQPLWGRFWEHPHLTERQSALFSEFRDLAGQALARRNLPSRLIHADLLQENVLVDRDQVWAIDFDDCAYGYEAFDLVTPLVQRLPDPRFIDLRDALLEGYGVHDREDLALFFAIRCLTYVGWIADKLESSEALAMSGRIIARAEAQTRAYLDGKSPINC